MQVLVVHEPGGDVGIDVGDLALARLGLDVRVVPSDEAIFVARSGSWQALIARLPFSREPGAALFRAIVEAVRETTPSVTAIAIVDATAADHAAERLAALRAGAHVCAAPGETEHVGVHLERMIADLATRRRLDQHLELLVNSADEGIYGVDLDGCTTFSNVAAASMVGRTVDEVLGQRQHALLHHSYADGTPYPRESCPIYAAFRDGAVHRVDHEVFWRKDGTSFPVEYSSRPMIDDGKLVGAVVTFRDITARRATERRLAETMRELEATQRELVASVQQLMATEGMAAAGLHAAAVADAARQVVDKARQHRASDAPLAADLREIDGLLAILAQLGASPFEHARASIDLVAELATGFDLDRVSTSALAGAEADGAPVTALVGAADLRALLAYARAIFSEDVSARAVDEAMPTLHVQGRLRSTADGGTGLSLARLLASRNGGSVELTTATDGTSTLSLRLPRGGS